MKTLPTGLGFGLFAILAQAAPTSAQDWTMGFTLSFDPATSAALSERGERVVISAFYFGDPARPNVAVDEAGQVYLGGEEHVVLPVDQRITLGANLANAALTDVIEPIVNINIYTSRRTHMDNLIDCDFIEWPVAKVAARAMTLNCVLLDR